MRKNNFSFLRTAEQAAINANGKVDETDFGLIRDFLDGKITLTDWAKVAANKD